MNQPSLRSDTSATVSPLAAERRAGLLLLLLTTLCWGLNWPVMKWTLTQVGPFTMRGYGGVVATVLAFATAALLGERLTVARRAVPRLTLFAFLNFTSWMGLATLSLRWLSASEAAIFAYTMPIWASLLAWPVLGGERPNPARVGGLALGLCGVALLVAGQPLAAFDGQVPGILCVLGAAWLFALGTVLSKRRPLGLPPIAGVAWQLGIGSVPLLFAAILFEAPDWSRLTSTGWAGVGYNTVFALFVAYLAWFAALRRLPASTAAMGTLLTPIVGVLAAAAALGEPAGPRELGALTLTLAGVALAVRA